MYSLSPVAWSPNSVTCPCRKPPFLAGTRTVRPHKSAIQKLFTTGNAEGA
jgi:hypothetical protein